MAKRLPEHIQKKEEETNKKKNKGTGKRAETETQMLLHHRFWIIGIDSFATANS
jgi:hypothetical protein